LPWPLPLTAVPAHFPLRCLVTSSLFWAYPELQRCFGEGYFGPQPDAPFLRPQAALPLGFPEEEGVHAPAPVWLPAPRRGLDPDPIELPLLCGLIGLGGGLRDTVLSVRHESVILLPVVGEQLVHGAVGVDRPDAHVSEPGDLDPELHH